MDIKFFLLAFLFPIIAFSLLGFIVFKYKQNVRPLLYILVIFVSLNIIHFKFGVFNTGTVWAWIAVINLEALVVYIFALLGWKKLKKLSE